VPELWSWLLAAGGILGLWLAGSGKPVGWLVGLGMQALWIAFALATAQYGFVVTALAYGAVYLRNWRKARNVLTVRTLAD
jgi:nicotinamide riboside transporter PnuC